MDRWPAPVAKDDRARKRYLPEARLFLVLIEINEFDPTAAVRVRVVAIGKIVVERDHAGLGVLASSHAFGRRRLPVTSRIGPQPEVLCPLN